MKYFIKTLYNLIISKSIELLNDFDIKHDNKIFRSSIIYYGKTINKMAVGTVKTYQI